MAGSYINGAGLVTFLDEVDTSCALNASDYTIGRAVVDARTFCGNAQVPGKRDVGTSFGGYGYFGAGEYEEQLNARLVSAADVRVLTVYGSTAGSRYYEVAGPLSGEKLTASPSELIGLSGEVPGGETLNRGLTLHVNQAFTATGAQTGQNVGAVAATETWVGVVRVKAVGGAGSITFRFDESSDNAAGDPYAQITGTTVAVIGTGTAGTDAATFTGTGMAVFTKAGAVEAWRRLNITAYATFTSVTLTVTTGTQMPG